eukprot:1065231-Pleurochrysis_carterae.AAC.2
MLQSDVSQTDGAEKVERARGAAHGPEQHAHGVGHVRPRLRGAVEQSADEGHVLAVDVRVYDSFPFGQQSCFHVLWQVFGGWDVGRTERARHSVEQTYPSPALMSTLSRSDTGPSSSTFQ